MYRWFNDAPCNKSLRLILLPYQPPFLNHPCSRQLPQSHTTQTAHFHFYALFLNNNRSILARDQTNLTRYYRPSLHCRSMMSCQLTINWHILVQVWQELFGTRSVAPVTHQITYDCEERVHLHASTRHLRVGSVTYERRGGTRGFDVGEDGVAGGAQGEGEEGCADVGGYTGKDDLFLAGRFDGGTEFGVVPGTFELC
jgi:hypothetical protein